MDEEMEENDTPPVSSHELLRMSLTTPMTKIKKSKRSPKLGLYRCDKCSKVFSDKWLLASHKAVHLDTADFVCTLCPYKGKTKKYLSRHMSKVHTEPTKYQCEDCGKKFHFLNRLECHRRVHTGEKPYECRHCEKRFSARYSLNTHLLVHSDEKPFKCSFCEYACRDSSTLRKHQHRHMGLETLYQCKKCDKSFKQKFKLKNHIAEIHLNVDMKLHKCELCGRQFKKKASLTQHIKSIHKKLMRCECKICGKMMSSKYNMTTHLRVHTEARPYVCAFEGCGKKFKDQSSMKKHNIIHFPSKHVECKVCGKLFSRVIRLKKHMAQHRERKKDVRCEYCGVCFYNEVYLQLHYRKKHDRKRKRYKCDLCGLSTSNKPSIVMHLKYGHAKDNDVKCKLCNIIFKKQEYLKMHYLRKHNKRYKPMKRQKKKPKKQQVIIKEEPVEYLDEQEIAELLTNVKEECEAIEEKPEYGDAIQYSDAVFSEDVAKSYIKHNSEKLTKLPEDVFDTFFIEHVYRRHVERQERVSIMDKEEEERGIKRYKELLSEIIGGTEIDIPDGVGGKSAEDETATIQNCTTKGSKPKRGLKRLASTSAGGNGTTVFDGAREGTVGDNKETTPTRESNRSNGERRAASKIKFNLHQCYVCFQVFNTKRELTKHCSQHFDVCGETQLKKCPLCTFVTKGQHFARHMRKVHQMQISYNYSNIQEDVNGKKYSFRADNGYDIEIVPSIKNLNKREYIKIDKQNRMKRDKVVTKTKLVKFGGEWVVQNVTLPTKDYIMPDVRQSGNYLEELREKYRECKRNGQKMLFPCQICEKKCQTFSALKLHLRRHDVNPKPFKKKVWKHKNVTENLQTITQERNLQAIREENLEPVTKEKRITMPVTDVLIDGKCLKIILKDCMKDKSFSKENIRLQNNMKPKAKRVRSIVTRDPLADPKPVTAKHKCDKELIEFYKNNIKGSDIEFWQFLKIFNKMTRENIQDFDELESRHDFGIHIDNRVKKNDEEVDSGSNKTETNQSSTNFTKEKRMSEGSPNVTRENRMSGESQNVTKEKGISEGSQDVTKEKRMSGDICRLSKEKTYKRKVNSNKNRFKELSLLSKSEYLRREEIRRKMREKILLEKYSK